MLKEIGIIVAIVCSILLLMPLILLFQFSFIAVYVDMALLIIILAFAVMDVIALDRKKEYVLRNYFAFSLIGALVLSATVFFLMLHFVILRAVA